MLIYTQFLWRCPFCKRPLPDPGKARDNAMDRTAKALPQDWVSEVHTRFCRLHVTLAKDLVWECGICWDMIHPCIHKNCQGWSKASESEPLQSS